MKKFIIGGGLVVAFALAAGMFLVVSNLNAIVAQVIENEGSDVTDTRVAVAGTAISLREGRGSLADLTIANPAGFAATKAFRLGEIVVDIDLKSVRSEPIVIEEIRVTAPVVNAEFRQDGSSNLAVLNRNVKEYALRFSTRDRESGSDDRPESPQKRIRIKRLVFEEGRIAVDATELGLERRTVELPAILLEDVGGIEGTTPAGIAQSVLMSLTERAAARIARAELEDRVGDAVEAEVEEQGKALLGKLGG